MDCGYQEIHRLDVSIDPFAWYRCTHQTYVNIITDNYALRLKSTLYQWYGFQLQA